MGSLRLPASSDAYRAYRKTLPPDLPCPLCVEEPLQRFTYWKLMNNNFPYDKIAQTHHMLVPNRHVPEEELNEEEKEEYTKIKREFVHPNYDSIIEATAKMKTIPAHFHLHLIVLKD